MSSQAQYTQPTSWFAVSTTAMGITGDIKFSMNALRINRHTYNLKLVHPLDERDLQNASLLMSYNQVPLNQDAYLFKTTIPKNSPMLGSNTPCGTKNIEWVLAIITKGKQDYLDLAFFSGAALPDLSPPAINRSTELCGTYGYLRTLHR
jgi:hypothetical protein